MRKAIAAVAVALLTLTACTDDNSDAGPESPSPTPTVSTGTPTGDTSDEATARENIRSGLLDTDLALTGTKITEDQANCLADTLVDNVGVDNLRKYNILGQDLVMQPDLDPGNLDPRTADAMAQSLTECINVGDMVVEKMDAAKQLTADQRECISEAVDESVFREQLSLALQGERADLTKGMRRNMMQCMTPGG